MASTWSNLGINLQGTGDNSGTWGQLTNVNLQDFDYAISGVAAITLTGNTTLAFTTNSSSTTYSNESGRAAVLVLSGSLSATTVTVTVPNIQKNYVIINNSGATATISAGGSTTVSLGTSTSAYVYSNGSSSIFTAITSNPGGTTNQVQYNNAGAFAGSTNLTFNGTTLAIQTATVLNLTSTTENITTANITTANVTTANVTSLTATNATVTTDNITTANITTANVTTANVTSLTYVNATGTTGNIANVNVITNGTLKLYNTANTFYTGLKVAAGATTTATFTLPSADGTSGQFLKTNGSGVLSFGAASAITWQSVQTTNFTAVAGNSYPVNTTSAGITVTLPVSASTGDTIQIVDYAGTAATNNIVLNPNGLKINSGTINKALNTAREAVTITYIDSTQGWLLTSDAQITLPNQAYSIDFLVVAGAGGGGGYYAGGGGGAGGYRTSTQPVPIGTVITVTVGNGGTMGGTGQTTLATSGSASSISGSGLTTISSAGGGGAGNAGGSSPRGAGLDGGSGGGAGNSNLAPGGGGNGNTPSTSPSQGNNGGTAQTVAPYRGGGGGGSSASGATGVASGNGGAGTASSITGSSVTYAGGGGAGVNTSGTAGTGGSGGGGNGSATTAGTNGTINTGGGGGGSGGISNFGGNGGSGVVILSLPTANYSSTTTGSPTVTTSGSNTILTFTGSGSYTA